MQCARLCCRTAQGGCAAGCFGKAVCRKAERKGRHANDAGQGRCVQSGACLQQRSAGADFCCGVAVEHGVFIFPAGAGGLLAVWLGALLAAWAAAQRCGLLDALVRCRWQLLAIVVLAVACAQFFVGLATRQTLTDDYGSVVNGALLYAQQGKSAAFAQQYQWYLNHWPNNRGIFFLLALFFRVLTALGFGGQWYTGMCAWPPQLCSGCRMYIRLPGPCVRCKGVACFSAAVRAVCAGVLPVQRGVY